jgi:hypothetical protein
MDTDDDHSTTRSGRGRARPAGRRPRPSAWARPVGHEEVAVRRSPRLDDLVGGGRPSEEV